MRLFPTVIAVGMECPSCGGRKTIWDEEKEVGGKLIRVRRESCRCRRTLTLYLDGKKVYETEEDE